MKIIMAVDIGGSKTKISLYGDNESAFYTVELEGFGKSEECTDDIPELKVALNNIAMKYQICSICINLGGKNKLQIERIFREIFPKAIISIYRESEGIAAITLGRKYNSETILLAGTGAIVIGRSKDKRFTVCDGWGTLFGDGGSGYDIGIQAIKQSIKEFDGNLPLSPLAKEILGTDENLGMKNDFATICELRDHIRMNIQPYDRRKIASYTRIVAKHCENGEVEALNIMNYAGEVLAESVIRTLEKIQQSETVQGIVVSGGLVNINNYWKKAFERKIGCKYIVKEYHYVVDGLMLGTYQIAKEQLERGCK